jgi:urease accessory protein
VRRQENRSLVWRQYSQSPLQLHKPLYLAPDAPPVVYIKTPSSGLLDGDEHVLDIEVEEGASLELRTQAATIVYPGQSTQNLTVKVNEGALFVYTPHTLILAKGAQLTQKVRIDLAAGASLLYQEDWCAGRIAMGECWQFGRYDYSMEIRQVSELTYRERWTLMPEKQNLTNPFICGQFTHFRTRVEIPDGALAAGGQSPARERLADQPEKPGTIDNGWQAKSWIMQTKAARITRTVSCLAESN